MKVGDRVKFVSDTGVGRVVKVNGSMIDVDIEDGFIMPCHMADLVVVQEEDEIAAIKSIGVGDERPGVKRGKAKPIEKKKESTKKEPAYAKYGKVSLVGDDEAGDDDEYLDLNRLNDIYIRNKVAEEQREREFEEARQRQLKSKSMVVESSGDKVEVEVVKQSEEMKPTTLEELASKMSIDAQKTTVVIPHKRDSDIEVIDLHAKEILDSTDGMSNGEIINVQLARFILSLDLAVKSGKRGKIVFIHGVGSGKLKMEIQKLLRSKYPKLASQDASFREYGYGAIMIFY